MDVNDSIARYTKPNVSDPPYIALLREWLGFWWNNDDLGKMPNGLHIATLVYLIEYDFNNYG